MSNKRINNNNSSVEQMDQDALQSGLNDIQPLQVPTVGPPIIPYKQLPPKDYEEWEYTMRRTMQEIIPGLYLGPYAAASKNKLNDLKAVGITHIICVRHVVERNVIRPVHANDFIYLIIEMADDASESLIPHCNVAHQFLDSCLKSGGKALVHGNAGISRSAALVIAYVMAEYGVNLKQALQYVQNKRFSANPNEWFMLQLKEYEPIYQARHDVPKPLPGTDPNAFSLKRELDLDDEEDIIID